MTVQPTSRQFKANAARALQDDHLRRAMGKARDGFVLKRRKAAAAVPEFEALRDAARDMKNHTLKHLDLYLERFERKATEAGTQVHWAVTAEDATRIVLGICADAKAKTVTKGKSMISEEMGLNAALEESGYRVVETDLGEYIIQLRGEAPSHIIAPAVHTTREQIAKDFRRVHTHLPEGRTLVEPTDFVAEARGVLREEYFAGDVGVTGANMLVAETGQSVIVTNEGNGDLTQSLARVHVVIASIEKIVPTLDDASTILRVLGRSATGQEMSVYTTFSRGPKREGDPDGPEECHIVLLDNGRTDMLGSEFEEMLRCIRCGACMNHCPVYENIGGHAYGWVYPGPMGAVLTPSLIGVDEAGHLPNASTFCGRCQDVCPMRIPLPGMMRKWRAREWARGGGGERARWALLAWSFIAARPRLYRRLVNLKLPLLARLARGRGVLPARIPGIGGWTKHRDLPAPQGRTFMDQWNERREKRS